jgi:hypothetical protein
MSFINTIEDDSDQVELIVRQRLEAKPGCNIVGFDAYDQAGAVVGLKVVAQRSPYTLYLGGQYQREFVVLL